MAVQNNSFSKLFFAGSHISIIVLANIPSVAAV